MEARVQAKYRLARITNKYHILDIMFYSYYRKRGFTHLHQASRSFRQLLRENYQAALQHSDQVISYAIENNKKVPCGISQIVIPETSFQALVFVHLSGDKLYAGTPDCLYVY